MARTLEHALNRVFRSRWGVALVLAVLVLAVVGIGRLFHGAAAEPPLTSGSPAAVISADPSDDDTVISAEPPPSPATFPGAAEPEAVAYAFASAWVAARRITRSPPPPMRIGGPDGRGPRGRNSHSRAE